MKIIKNLRSLPSGTLMLIRRTPPLVFAMAVLSLGGFIGASTVLVRGFRMVENSITVTGASTESFESDIAKWSVQVRASGKTQIDSFNKHKQSMKATMDFLKANGIVDGIKQEVYLGPASIREYETKHPKTNEIIRTEWITYQNIEIQSSDVYRIQRTHSKITELLGKGVRVSPSEPKYTYSKLADKRVDMLAKAARDARIRAEAIAFEAGSEVGGLKKVNTGVFQITVPNSTTVSSWGSYDTTTIKKDITAVMGVTFAVK
tara:strand:- start:666 stop:1448 length:783 start_codon:yes stop_codon:yes gene_type:complete